VARCAIGGKEGKEGSLWHPTVRPGRKKMPTSLRREGGKDKIRSKGTLCIPALRGKKKQTGKLGIAVQKSI